MGIGAYRESFYFFPFFLSGTRCLVSWIVSYLTSALCCSIFILPVGKCVRDSFSEASDPVVIVCSGTQLRRRNQTLLSQDPCRSSSLNTTFSPWCEDFFGGRSWLGSGLPVVRTTAEPWWYRSHTKRFMIEEDAVLLLQVKVLIWMLNNQLEMFGFSYS